MEKMRHHPENMQMMRAEIDDKDIWYLTGMMASRPDFTGTKTQGDTGANFECE